MNGNRNHLPEVAFVTWLKRHLGKKRYFHCLGKTRSLYALPEHIHSQLSLIFIQTLWSTPAKSFTPYGWCNLQFGFIGRAQESKDSTARLLLAPNVPPAPSPTWAWCMKDELLKRVQCPLVEHFVSRALGSKAQHLLRAPRDIVKQKGHSPAWATVFWALFWDRTYDTVLPTPHTQTWVRP